MATSYDVPPPGFDALRDLGYSFDPPFPATPAPAATGNGSAPTIVRPTAPQREGVHWKARFLSYDTKIIMGLASLWSLFCFALFYIHAGLSYAVGITFVNLFLVLMLRGVASSSRGGKVKGFIAMAVVLLLFGRNLTGLVFGLFTGLALYSSYLRTGKFLGTRDSGYGPAPSISRFVPTSRNGAGFQAACQPTWGVPGGNIGGASHFGSAGAMGQKGEKYVGDALNALQTRYPYIRVFHGLRFLPNSNKPWDVDHMVLIGRTLYFIDAKAWAYGTYQWLPNGEVGRDGGTFSGGQVHMDDALKHWRNYLPRNVVIAGARITFALPQAQKYSIIGQGNDGLVQLATLPTVLAELEAQAQMATPVVDRVLVDAVARQLL